MVTENESIYIPVGAMHMENPGVIRWKWSRCNPAVILRTISCIRIITAESDAFGSFSLGGRRIGFTAVGGRVRRKWLS